MSIESRHEEKFQGSKLMKEKGIMDYYNYNTYSVIIGEERIAVEARLSDARLSDFAIIRSKNCIRFPSINRVKNVG